MHALLVAAAEHAEPSKTAFFIAGGALAAWAVLLSFFGLTRPDFPGNAAAARGVMAISTVLVAAAAITAVATA
jgi:hypothetical protein